MQLQVGWAHGPTLRSGAAQRSLLGHGPNLQFTTKFLNLMAVTHSLTEINVSFCFYQPTRSIRPYKKTAQRIDKYNFKWVTIQTCWTFSDHAV